MVGRKLMAGQLVREWTAIQQFPAATQEKLVDLLGKLKNQERVVTVSAFQSETPRPVMVSRSRSGFTLNIIDTQGSLKEDMSVTRFLLNKTIDVLLYVDRLDSYRVDNLDKQIVKAITDSFGKEYGTKPWLY
ncbi:Translocase of chloroplast [Sesamum angolense]|uniref:Translocase of chloroplast n=1 Tax=Sesamum angolense TaxID=2727404 RepID=A0AAE1T7I7_9LAMI|nr:Translocase of chloroplast [Sesamum angolense]